MRGPCAPSGSGATSPTMNGAPGQPRGACARSSAERDRVCASAIAEPTAIGAGNAGIVSSRASPAPARRTRPPPPVQILRRVGGASVSRHGAPNRTADGNSSDRREESRPRSRQEVERSARVHEPARQVALDVVPHEEGAHVLRVGSFTPVRATAGRARAPAGACVPDARRARHRTAPRRSADSTATASGTRHDRPFTRNAEP